MPRLLRSLVVLLVLSSSGASQTALFVTSRFTDEVLRYDAASGAFLGVFAAGGGLDNPVGLTFGPDGHLYVASGDSDEVLRYDGTSGAFLGVFAAGGNLSGPTSFTFGPDGDLYVGSVLTHRVKRFDGASGVFLGNFVAQGLNGPHDLAFGPDGLFYVSNAFDNRVKRFDGTSGALVDVFIADPALSAPLGLAWDELGRLYVANQGGNEVRRYDGETGAYLDSPVAPGAGGLSGPLFTVFRPSSPLAIHAPVPGVAGMTNWLSASGATPGAALLLAAGRTRALRVLPGCSPLLGLPGGELRVPCIADESGRVLFRWQVAPAASGVRFYLRAAEPENCAASALTVFRF